MVKQYKKNSKSKKNKSLSMKGGDDGRFSMPGAYFGNGLDGYYAAGSPELKSVGKQHAVSQGTVSSDGFSAGPNLFPMKGGKCGCNKTRKYKSLKSLKSLKKNLRKHKSKKNNKHKRSHKK